MSHLQGLRSDGFRAGAIDAILMHGLPVFPCRPASGAYGPGKMKSPLVPGWDHQASADLNKIEAWSRDYPDAMIGMPTREYLVIDVDTGPKKAGATTFAALEERLGPLPQSCRVRTPNGGFHIYFIRPSGVEIKSSAGELGPGLDVRGCSADGKPTGYVIIPPSTNAAGQRYTWLSKGELMDAVELPHAWLFRLMFSKSEHARLEREGIVGAEYFGDLPPDQWRQKVEPVIMRKRQLPPRPGRALDPGEVRHLVRYASKAVQEECAKLAATPPGSQRQQCLSRSMALAGLVLGLQYVGLHEITLDSAGRFSQADDFSEALADLSDRATSSISLEAAAALAFEHAVVSMAASRSDWPWTAGDAEVFWQTALDKAEPRDLSRVLAPADAAHEFDAIDGAAIDGSSSLLEFPADISFEQIKQHQDRALLKGLLYPGETAVIYGDPAAGKTFIALDMGYHIALGRDWHGRRAHRAPVLYVGLEGKYGLRKRVMAAARKHGGTAGFFASLVPQVILSKDAAGQDGLLQVLAAAKELQSRTRERVGLIIIDTIARAIAGDDENSTADMMMFIERRAGEIARQTGAAVLLIHHTNKAGGMRGSGSLKGAVETQIRVERDGNSRQVIAEKVKDDVEGPLFSFNLEVVDFGTDSAGEPITSCVIAKTEGPKKTKPTPAAKRVAKAVGIFHQAFEEAAPAADEGLGTEGAPPLGSRLMSEVRRVFRKHYGGKAEAAARAWRRNSESLPSGFVTGAFNELTYVWCTSAEADSGQGGHLSGLSVCPAATQGPDADKADSPP